MHNGCDIANMVSNWQLWTGPHNFKIYNRMLSLVVITYVHFLWFSFQVSSTQALPVYSFTKRQWAAINWHQMKTAGRRLWGSNQSVCTRGRLQHCGLINTSHKHVYINSSAAEVPVKFQSDWTILTANLAASRLHEILQIRCLIGYSGVLNSRTYRNKWTPGKICRKLLVEHLFTLYLSQQIKEHPAPFCHCANNQTRLTIMDTGVLKQGPGARWHATTWVYA